MGINERVQGGHQNADPYARVQHAIENEDNSSSVKRHSDTCGPNK